jgi:hypothetical protein
MSKPGYGRVVVHMSRWQLVVGLAAVIMAGLLAPYGTADDKVPLGGGARIVVNASAYCTLGAIGNDSKGELVGFTASRCGGVGAPVAAEGGGGLGSVAAANEDLGYAVIKFDSTKVIPAAAFDGFPINGIGSDPGFGQQACIEGGATGSACGVINNFPGQRPGNTTLNLPAWELGDDGAPATVGGQLVGLIAKGHVMSLVPPQTPPGGPAQIRVALFSAIMNDVNAKGGPGAGFSPAPG